MLTLSGAGQGQNGSPVDLDSFIIQVQTDNTGTSADNQFTLRWIGTYDVDWGDGNVDTGVTNTQTHTYSSVGTYDVSVTATSGQIYFNNLGDKLKLLDIKQWGTCEWTSFNRAFQGCSNMNATATDNPNLSNVLTFYRCFHSCSSFNADISNWDVSNVTNIYQMFLSCTVFNQDISGWDVSSVNTMAYLFYSAINFNQPIGNWDISNVTDLNNVFIFATSFNQPLNNWNVSNVTNMQNMFFDAAIFNQPLDSWDVSNVTNMGAMFNRCYGFDQDISNWQVTQVTQFTNFMTNVTLSTANYDALLIAWDAQGAMSFSGTVNFGNSQYTLGGAAETARTSLISKWGGIVDGGGVLDATTNLVASYNFDSDFTDYTGNNNLTATGSATAGVTGGKVSDCAELDGSSSYDVSGNSNDFSFTNGINDLPFSVSTWVNANSTPGNYGVIFSKRNSSNFEYQFVYIYNGGNPILRFTLFSNNSTSNVGFNFNYTLAISTWNHLAITYDGSGSISGANLYVNGYLQTTTPISGTYTGMANTTSDFNIGRFANSINDFDGKFDELHVWKNRELSAGEVLEVYNTENGGASILP